LQAANDVAALDPKVDEPPELRHAKGALARLWDARHQIGTLVHYRKPLGEWTEAHLAAEPLRRLFLSLAPSSVPTLFLLFVLGYLSKGWLSRPVGGTAKFRDALVDTYRALGGEEHVNATVEEVLVEHGRARGVRLSDGTILDADVVISTSSTPETTLHLLGGRYAEAETRRRLEDWKLFDPIVIVSFGVADRLEEAPPAWILDGIPPFEVGGKTNERLTVRVFNDDATLAPPGHTVVQCFLSTSYEWWATRGSAYPAEKDAVAEAVLAKLAPYLPPLRHAVRMIDVATPLTYWNMARSWRGAYEGWTPEGQAFAHPKKKLAGLEGFYMAGQWVEPGGGVPTAIMSGRQVVQLLCADLDRAFVAPRPVALEEEAPSRGGPRPAPARATGPA
jgi:phytoene dehydrogenase-like protein